MQVVSIVLLVVGAMMAILFQAVGIYATAWLRYETTITDTQNWYTTHTTQTIGIGLWKVSACVMESGAFNVGSKTCGSVSVSKLSQAIEDSSQSRASKDASQEMLKSFLPMQVLCIIGGLAAIVGVSLVISYFKQIRVGAYNKNSAIAAVVLHLLSGALVLSAVGIQADRDKNFRHDIDQAMSIPEFSDVIQIEVFVPWAIIMSGIGAGFNVLVGLAFSLYLYCQRNEERPAPAATNTPNTAVYDMPTRPTHY